MLSCCSGMLYVFNIENVKNAIAEAYLKKNILFIYFAQTKANCCLILPIYLRITDQNGIIGHA